MKISRLHFISLLFFPFLISCKKETSAGGDNTKIENITVQFDPVVMGQPLVYGTDYINSSGETFSVRAFKFYVNAIELVGNNPENSETISNYYLINFADPASTTIQIKSIPAEYTKIGFVIGVDSLHNVSGTQTGALDPSNGMFWTWNSGYIMAKLEGYSPVSNQPNHLFEYHIGGFKGDENVVQKLTLDISSESIDTRNGQHSILRIGADADKWFNGVHPINISTVPVCMTPGPLSKEIADNYLTMLSVEGVVNQ